MSLLTKNDLYLFNEGTHSRLYQKLGSHLATHNGVAGATFAVWAPNADFRFAGLATELTILLERHDNREMLAAAAARFRERFAARFGFSRPADHEVELVALRVSGRGLIARPRLPEIPPRPQAQPRARRDVFFVETGVDFRLP